MGLLGQKISLLDVERYEAMLRRRFRSLESKKVATARAQNPKGTKANMRSSWAYSIARDEYLPAFNRPVGDINAKQPETKCAHVTDIIPHIQENKKVSATTENITEPKEELIMQERDVSVSAEFFPHHNSKLWTLPFMLL